MRFARSNPSSNDWSHGVLFLSFLIYVAVLVLIFALFEITANPAVRSRVRRSISAVVQPEYISSHLYQIQARAVELEEFTDSGGAIEPLGENLLLVTPRGRIALVHADGEVEYLPQRVPMNETALEDPTLPVGFRESDILLHEETPERFTLFVSHHYFAGECIEFRISSISLRLDHEGAEISDGWKTEFTATPCIIDDLFGYNEDGVLMRGGRHSGGRMLMDGDDQLLVVTGDHTWHETLGHSAETLPLAGPDSHLSKLIRIELTSGKAEVVANGFRNPQGFARDAEGNLWQTEHGPQGGDELNLLRPNLHYGWPYVTLGIRYGNKTWPYSKAQGRHDSFEKPAFSWTPAIGISNLIVSDSQQFPMWKGDLLIGSLAAHSLFRVRLHEERVVYVEQIRMDFRIRDITQMPDGRIALLYDNARIHFLQRAPVDCQAERDLESIYAYDADDNCVNISEIIGDSNDPSMRFLNGAGIGFPIIRSRYYVYAHQDRLIFAKSPCNESDLLHRFFLHISPRNVKVLDIDRRQLGFNAYDFYADEDGVGSVANENGCIVVRALPEYEIDRIYTGQVSTEGAVWEGSHTFPDSVAAAHTENSPSEQEGKRSDHTGAALFAARCANCHNLAAEHYIGPHLEAVIGRRAGRVAGFTGSAALTSLDIVWTGENLADFIANPSQFAPGTTMSDAGITAEKAQIIADFLASGN